ncbi:MAG: hypothetical protein APR63_05495 [Desulfuromonas sp. SDB]|nr:MAG: hypothetical protein APR63_05495 [Desulfuromonas sp. SDB]
MSYHARSALENVKPYIPGKPIEEVARELNLEVSEIVKLASNENPLGPSPLALKAIEQNLNSLNYYPDDLVYYLKQDLASKYQLDIHNIIVSNGSAELIMISVISHLEKGDNLVMGWPGFVIPKIASDIMGAEVKFIPTDQDYYQNVDGLISGVDDKTKIVYIDNPTNPLGTFLPPHKIKQLLTEIPGEVLVIIDQAYYEYLDPHQFISPQEILKLRNNVLILQTFSKIYGLAGLRIGYGFSRPEVITNLGKVRIPFNVNSLAQIGARAALKDVDHLNQSRSLNDQERKYIEENLANRNYKTIPSFTNFITFQCKMEGVKLAQKLLDHGIILRPLHAYGQSTLIRVTTGNHSDNQKFFAALDKLKSS